MTSTLLLLSASALASYFIGAIPFSYLIPKLFLDTDVRQHGSGNPGASNVSRVCGKGYGIAALFLDVAKGVFALYLVQQMGGVIALGFLAILGHIANPFFGFSGGKGVATSLGAISYLSPLAGLVFVAVWAAVFLIWNIAGLSSLSAITVVPVSLYFLGEPSMILGTSVGLVFLIYFTHRGNISRLLKGEERTV
ncbi:glycerol-3-phosphate 1-O-acyltransferase PlsY [Candidatus Bipolaricaulota bacterium]|nr:glycerol-3-phosphate 1-O-acyltransferase PlsY [Candidatus Bipolaricaulota bacterium]